MLDALIEYVNGRDDEFKQLKKSFEDDVQNILDKYKKLLEDDLEIDYRHYNYTYRFAQGEAHLRRDVPDYGYYSLMAGERNNLLRWIKRMDKGKEEIVEFEDYGYYPALNLDTQELAYLRIHTSRITYRITSYSHRIVLRDKVCSVDVEFVTPSKAKGNIRITINPFYENDEATLEYFFNGKNFILKNETYSSDAYKDFLKDNLIDRPIKGKRFLFELIEPYKFTTRKDAIKDIEKFAPEWHYNVGILDIHDFPMLIFRASKE